MGNRPLRITFALQGEGRGHMTQALALAAALRAAGHSIEEVWVGLGPGWEMPAFFSERIGAPVRTFRGPTHTLNRARTRVSAFETTRDLLLGIPAFLKAARQRKAAVTSEGTDVVVGFYDAVGGIARVLGHRIPTVVVGHHYVLFHPDAPRLSLSGPVLYGFKWITRLTARRATEVLALSFSDLPVREHHTGPGRPGRSASVPRVVPPLLRSALSAIDPRDDGHLLAYAVTPGIGDRVVAWQRARPEVPVHLYLAGGRSALGSDPGPGCQVHDLDDRAFLEHMGSCHAYAGSAGFESLCEAFYLGKPVLAVPTAGQVEQHLNAVDGARAGVVRAGEWSDLDDFWDTAQPADPEPVQAFREWVDTGPARIVSRVEAAARSQAMTTGSAGRPERTDV